MANYMFRSGPCIRLTKTVDNGKYKEDWYADKTFVFPMDQEFSISSTQTLVKPIEKMFQYIQDAVIGVSGDLFGSTGSTLARAGLEIANLTGFQLGTKGYYSKAWAGSQPSSFTMSCKFYRGMQGKWDASLEVFGPSRRIYALSLPYEPDTGSIVLLSPVPSPLTVFTTFAAQVVSDAIKSITSGSSGTLDASKISTSAGVSAISNLSGKSSLESKSTQLDKKNQFIATDTWKIELGYFDKNGGNVTSFLTLNRYVVETSTIKFGQQMEKGKDGFFIPTTAEVSLSFVSQDVLTSANFQEAKNQKLYNN